MTPFHFLAGCDLVSGLDRFLSLGQGIGGVIGLRKPPGEIELMGDSIRRF